MGLRPACRDRTLPCRAQFELVSWTRIHDTPSSTWNCKRHLSWPHLDFMFDCSQVVPSQMLQEQERWSGRPDLNRGPLAPKISSTTVNPCVSTAPSSKIPPTDGGFVPICSQDPSPDSQAIRQEVEAFAERLARRFPQAFADVPSSASKEDVIHWIRAALPPHPGRPRKPSVTLACRLRREGVPWPEIYLQCIENLAAFDWRKRRQEICRLRNAYRARYRLPGAHESKKPPSVSHARKN